MWDQLIFIVLGAMLAVAGGFLQSLYNNRKERNLHLLQKKEEAYLKYIDALLALKEDLDGSIDFKDYWPKYKKSKPEIELYASEQTKSRIEKYETWLKECWDLSYNVNDVIKEANNVIIYLRDDLRIN